MRGTIQLILISLVVFAFCSLGSATVYTVKQSGGGDATTVQGGINLATQPGDIVEIYSGTYNEDLTMTTPSITLRAAAGETVSLVSATGASFDPSDNAIIDGSQPGASLSIQHLIAGTGACTIKNLTWTNIPGNQAFQAADLTIQNCTMNISSVPNGMVPAGGTVTLQDTIVNCSGITNYGIISIGGNVVLDNVEFYGNSSSGGGIIINAPGNLTISNSKIDGWTGGNGAITNVQGATTITNSTFTNCDHALYADGANAVNWTNVRAEISNYGIQLGGGYAGTATIDHCIFKGTGASTIGILGHRSTLNISNSIFYNCSGAGVQSGVISPTITIDQCDFYYDDYATSAGARAVYFMSNVGVVGITDSIISGYGIRIDNAAGGTLTNDYNFYPNDGGVFVNVTPGTHSLVNDTGTLYYCTNYASGHFLQLLASSNAATLNSTGTPPYAGSQGLERQLIFTVKKDGSGDSKTVQGGLALATRTDDIVEIYSGTYTEDLTMPTPSITLRSAAGETVSLVSATGLDFDPSDNAIIDGGLPGSSLSLQEIITGTGACTVKNLTWTNIPTKQALQASDITIQNCTLNLDNATYGMVPNGNVRLENTTVNCSNIPYGILPISGNTYLKNVALNGGVGASIGIGMHAGVLTSGTLVSINNWPNGVANNAGLSGTLNLTDATFTNCPTVVTADAGGPTINLKNVNASGVELGLWLGGTSTANVTIDGCKFFGKPGGTPRGIHVHKGTVSVTNSIFHNFDHAGLWVGSVSPTVTIDQCDLYYDSTSSATTTGLLIDSGSVTITDSIISGFGTRINKAGGATLTNDYNFYPADGGVFIGTTAGANSLVDNPGPLYYSTDPMSADFLKLYDNSPAATLNSTGTPPYAGSQGLSGHNFIPSEVDDWYVF
ncbi:right-handed parallel beta-helix repeat-containing protein [Candidatus Sumerlaeota bacterium]|nr:right-handed parallel beta-helix repeat-containing protein [Candidatus Sumerlaeota bacterium]